MKAVLAVSMETFLRLRRDRIFWPAALAGVSLLLFSGLASYWGVEEFFKILYDFGSAAWLWTGAIVAIFWGNKIVSDSRQEGSIEVQLASPISRSAWLLGKFFGLSSALILLGLILLAGWQLLYLSYGMGFLQTRILLIFGLLSLSWLVLGALSIFLSCLASATLALFCSLWLFVTGLLTAPIYQSLAEDTPESVRQLVSWFTAFWNLHSFNLSEYGMRTDALFPSNLELWQRFGHGLALIAVFMSLACFSFQRRDIIA